MPGDIIGYIELPPEASWDELFAPEPAPGRFSPAPPVIAQERVTVLVANLGDLSHELSLEWEALRARMRE